MSDLDPYATTMGKYLTLYNFTSTGSSRSDIWDPKSEFKSMLLFTRFSLDTFMIRLGHPVCVDVLEEESRASEIQIELCITLYKPVLSY